MPLRKSASNACCCLLLAAIAPAAAPAPAEDRPGLAEAPVTAAGRLVPQRRKDPFPEEFGYALFPYPYSLPGLGSGLSLVGGVINAAGTHTDAYGIVFGGDVKGAAFGVADLHLLPRRLILEIGYGALSKASIQAYSQRGMESGADDYRLLEFGDTEFYGGRLTASFYDRRLEAYGAWYGSAQRLKAIRDKDGQLIAEAQNAPRSHGETMILGGRLDLTDDYADPRRGVRLDVSRNASPPRGSGPDYAVMDYNASAFVPLGRRSTWAFNVLRSDAVVSRQGQTDPAMLEQETGLQCGALTDPAQQALCNEVIANLAAENRYGTATQLGGFSRLRGYPQGRFKAAHTLFVGTEIRWNLQEEHTPFDIFVMKDVRTLVQLAFFYEAGITSDDRSDLRNRHLMRDTVGTGLRVVTASGIVFRADVGWTQEGTGLAVFIGYPWELQ